MLNCFTSAEADRFVATKLTVGHKSAGLAMVNLPQEKVLRRLGRFPLEFYMMEMREDWKKRRWKVGKN